MTQTIYPTSRADAATLARRLLDIAGPDRHDEIRTTTDGPVGIAFEAPDDVYTTVFADADAAPVVSGDGEGLDSRDGHERADREPLASGGAEDTEPPGDPAGDGAPPDDAGNADTAAAPRAARQRRRGAEPGQTRGRS